MRPQGVSSLLPGLQFLAVAVNRSEMVHRLMLAGRVAVCFSRAAGESPQDPEDILSGCLPGDL